MKPPLAEAINKSDPRVGTLAVVGIVALGLTAAYLVGFVFYVIAQAVR